MADENLRKIDLHLCHFPAHTLIDLLRVALLETPMGKIAEFRKKRYCQAGIRRAAPPYVSCWIPKYNGEAVGVDICYSFVDTRDSLEKVGRAHALVTIVYHAMSTAHYRENCLGVAYWELS